MKKKVFGRKLSRSRPTREALFASLTRAMILNDKIVTTKAKAKAVITDIEKSVTLAKKATLASRRQVLASLDNAKDATDKLFKVVAVSFKDRKSGYTRMINLGPRKGDNAKMVRIEWTEKIEMPEVKKEEKPKKETKTKKVVKKVTKKDAKNVSTKTKRN